MRSSWRRDGKRISEAAEADAPLFTTHTAECSAMRGFSDLGATHQGAQNGGVCSNRAVLPTATPCLAASARSPGRTRAGSRRAGRLGRGADLPGRTGSPTSSCRRRRAGDQCDRGSLGPAARPGDAPGSNQQPVELGRTADEASWLWRRLRWNGAGSGAPSTQARGTRRGRHWGKPAAGGSDTASPAGTLPSRQTVTGPSTTSCAFEVHVGRSSAACPPARAAGGHAAALLSHCAAKCHGSEITARDARASGKYSDHLYRHVA